MLLGFHWQLDAGGVCVLSETMQESPPSHPYAFPQVRGQVLGI